jgi:hypothetical protein
LSTIYFHRTKTKEGKEPAVGNCLCLEAPAFAVKLILAELIVRSVCVVLFCLASIFSKADFIENKGQWPEQVLFAINFNGGKMFIERDRLLYLFFESVDHTHTDQKNVVDYHNDAWAHSYEVRFTNGSKELHAHGEDDTSTTVYNYIAGTDAARWVSGAHSYRRVVISDIYPGIDMILYSKGTEMKYDLVVNASAKADKIQMRYAGLDKMLIDNGNLRLQTHIGESTEMTPYTYQVIDGKQIDVPCQFHLHDNTVSFDFPKGFDRSRKLVIDPLIIFSAYSGSTADNWGNTATYDAQGNLYSAGIVAAVGYPTTTGAYQVSHAGGNWDIGIMKYDSAGGKLLYATYLGGNSSETPQSMVVNNAGELLILGTTSSRNFPITNGSTFRGGNSFEPMDGVPYNNGSDIFIAKLNSTGTALVSSTFIGGTGNDGVNFVSGVFDTQNMVESALGKNYGDQFRGDIITDRDDNVFIASNSSSASFPVTTGGAFHGGTHDAVVVKLMPDLSSIIWARFLGGSGTDAAYSIKLSGNEILVAGGTSSNNFNGMNGYKTTNAGGVDGWAARLSADGTEVLSATYVGTSAYDQSYFLDINTQGDVYLFGQTKGAYPISAGVFSQTGGGQFIHKLSSDLKTSIFSTTIGSGGYTPNISPTAFLVSDCNKIYLAGWGGALNTTVVRLGPSPFSPTITRNFVGGNTNGMLTSADAYQRNTSGNDFYLMVLDADASAFIYGTFLGGNLSPTHVDGGTSRFDKRGIVYHAVCAGCGGYSDFPSVNAPAGHRQNGATGRFGGAGCNNAAFKFDLATLAASFQTNNVAMNNPGISSVCFPDSIVFQNQSRGAKYYQWDFGDSTVITTSSVSPITHAYKAGGVYFVKLIAFNNETCEGSDVASTVISVFVPHIEVVDDGQICSGSSYQLYANGGANYLWKNENGDFNSTTRDPIVTPKDTTLYIVTVSDNNGCKKTDSVLVKVIPEAEFTYDIQRVFDCWNRPLAHFTYSTGDDDVKN